MADLQLLDCFQPALVRLERVKYFPRQLLTADDMVTDQDYFRQKLRRHNRFLHGWGVVCGLGVTAAPTQQEPWRVKIDSGCALGPYGDEIYVAEPVFLDLARCGPGAVTDPCEPDRLRTDVSTTGGRLFVAIKYAECVARPVRAMPAGCACEEMACEYSRIRDSFQIECLTELPPSHHADPSRPLLCDLINSRRLPPCLPCPADPWVVLAQVVLPTSGRVTDSSIDNFAVRRQIYSTAVLQEQLIKCCCAGPELPAPTITSCEAQQSTGTAAPSWEITLRWTYNSDADRVNIQRSLDGTTWNTIATDHEGTTYVDRALPGGRTFHYHVQAHRLSDGQLSDWSTMVTCSTVGPN